MLIVILKQQLYHHYTRRSYLRKSRILDNNSSDVSVSNTGEQQENMISIKFPNYQITPRDILKFAWQISKGMSYLAELKVKRFDHTYIVLTNYRPQFFTFIFCL